MRNLFRVAGGLRGFCKAITGFPDPDTVSDDHKPCACLQQDQGNDHEKQDFKLWLLSKRRFRQHQGFLERP